MISTMIPEIWLVLVSRKVKGMPVGVEPTRTTCWAALAPINPSPRAAATRTRQSNLANMARSLLRRRHVYESAWMLSARRRRSATSQVWDDDRKRDGGCQTLTVGT